MSSSHDATIYLSSSRGCSQTDCYRSFYTFNFETYYNEHKHPFFNLTALNEDTLKGRYTLAYTIDLDTLVVLLPVVGEIDYQVNEEPIIRVAVGELCVVSVIRNSTLKITNPYENELVNIIQARMSLADHVETIIQPFDLDCNINSLLTLISKPTLKIHVGKFSGRVDYIFLTSLETTGVFAFVIDGVFEFQNRLLEQKDGLAISNVQQVEFEALSSEAIMLIFEV